MPSSHTAAAPDPPAEPRVAASLFSSRERLCRSPGSGPIACRLASVRPVTSSRSALRPAPTSPSSLSDRHGSSGAARRYSTIGLVAAHAATATSPLRCAAPSARHPSPATPAHHQSMSQTCSHLVDVLAGTGLTGVSRKLPAMVGGVVVGAALRGPHRPGAPAWRPAPDGATRSFLRLRRAFYLGPDCPEQGRRHSGVSALGAQAPCSLTRGTLAHWRENVWPWSSGR